MRRTIIYLASMLLITATLSGCIVEPWPWYGEDYHGGWHHHHGYYGGYYDRR